MNDIVIGNERDLKNKINECRTEIEKNDRILRSIFNELKLHRTDLEDAIQKRDELNAKVKEQVAKARTFKINRDVANKEIAELKKLKNSSQEKIKSIKDNISHLKSKRDDFNKISKGNLEFLSKVYADELDKILNADIPLEHEISIFKRLSEFKNRINAAQMADEVHKSIMDIYKNLKGVVVTEQDLHKKIKSLASESQKNHLEMLEIYSKIDVIRKEADEHHLIITSKRAITTPLRNKIDPLKAKIASLRDTLDIYLDKLNGISIVKDEKRIEDKHMVAKERYEQTGKMSLEDLKLLMEKGDLKF